MKKLAVATLTAALLASCGGHGSNALPPGAGAAQSAVTGVRTATLAVAPTGWANTSTQALKIVNASDTGATNVTQTLNITVGLAMRNQSQLASAVASGQQVDDGTFMATYAPTSAQVSAVTSYLQSKGLTNISVSQNNLVVTASGTAAHVQSAFNTNLHSFAGGTTPFFANVTPAYVPSNLGGIVVAVLGLNNLQAFKPTPHVTSCSVEGQTTPPQECLRFYDPATFQKAYDATGASSAYATPIAIMAEGDPTQAITDFRTNESKFGLPQVPLTRVQVGLASTDTAGNGEWTLDMTYSTGIAQNVKALYLYTTTSLTDQDIALEYNKWVTQHYTNVGNSSFGGCEVFPYLDGSMVIMDNLLLEGASHGQTMFASSGDNGGYCNQFVDTNGAPGGAPFVEYPAASPYVTAVGGTDLFSNADGSYKGETPWEAGGGGISQFEYSPYWETGVQPVDKAGSFRGVPDVALDASLETGAELWGGQAANGSCTPCVTGGTSLASPLMAGIWARAESAHGNSLGFAPIRLYKDFTGHAAGAVVAGPPAWQPDGGFHDILTGTNGLYTALPGYDYTTGLGSPDIATLIKQI
ncbi:MAG TPA: S53 family peptidase [Candidatus Baltobacteraceae bacterium]|nr:S53 family peptidase [Candidatus Baltobacteraceae bacterium]